MSPEQERRTLESLTRIEAKLEAVRARMVRLLEGLQRELEYWEGVHANGSGDEVHIARQHIAAITAALEPIP
jgi:hypothetical protein